MGGLSFWHVLVVAVVLLALIAHRHIPSAMEALGRAISRLRHGQAAKRPLPDNVIEGRFERRDN